MARRRAAAARRRRRAALVLAVGVVGLGVLLLALAFARPEGARDGPAGGAEGGTVVVGGAAAIPIGATAGRPTSTLTTTAATPAPPGSAGEAGARVESDVEIEIGWVGDLTPGSMYGEPPDEGRALFAATRVHTMSPDIMVANLEGTFGAGGPSKCDGRDSSNCYAFQADPQNAQALAWAGIDVVNLANNHSYDYFAAGAEATKEALAANGVSHTGLLDTVAIREARGVRVAFLGFSPYSYSPDIGDLAAARDLVTAAGEEADIVVVLMHAGAEGADKVRVPEGGETAYGEFRGDSRAFSHAVIEAGADLVLGSGPHVIRGLEVYEDRVVAYSLGNFAGWGNFSTQGNLALSGLLTVRMAADGRVLGGRWLSLRFAEAGVPEVDEGDASLELVRDLSQADFATPVRLGADGTFTLSTSR